MVIDVSRLLGRLFKRRLPTGVDRVDIEYVRYFAHRCDALIRFRNHWLLLPHDTSLKLFDILIRHDSSKLWTIGKMLAWHYLFSSAVTLEGRKLLNISHSGLNQEVYRQKIEQYKLRAIFFVHDLIPIDYPEYSRYGEDGLHRYRMETVLRYGGGVIVNSKDTLINLETYAKNCSLPMIKSLVAYLATAPLPPASTQPLLNQPYFVMLGTIEPRKNHWFMLHIWRNIVQKLGQKTPLLIIIGRRGWKYENVVDMLERCSKIRPYVIEKSACTDLELSTYLAHAQALLFPSFVEGYGMPLVEALSIGTPVITSNLSVFREIAGDTPEYLEPLDGEGWEKMIVEYAQFHSEKRIRQVERIKTFSPTTWIDHFISVDKFLDDCDCKSLEN